jgi:hypothetical protein
MKQIAKIISILFHPLFIPTYGTFLLYTTTRFQQVPWLPKLIVAVMVFCCTAIIPAMFIYLFLKLGKITTVTISNRKERTRPYIYSLGAYLLCAYYVSKVNMPGWYVAMLCGSAISIVSLILINLKWKISAHLSGMGGLLAGILVVSFRYILNPVALVIAVILLSAAVASSRISLDEHTPAQTLAGFFNGFIFVLFSGLMFG